MRPQRRFTGPILLGALALLLPPGAMACRCKEPAEISGPYARAAAVVLAKVSNVAANPKIDGFTVILQVSEVWKDSIQQMIRVETGTDCRFPFVEGREYLVVLLKVQSGYTTGRCLGNRPAAEARAAIQWLNSKGVRGKVQ
jgi:hypothetical protein